MEKKYQIFISSTFEDLKEERQKVIETILMIHHFPVGMEAFGARSKEQWDVIRETIDTSDYYVLIIKHRYGTIEQKSGKSYTELEFDYAVSKNIPILAFIINDNVEILPKYMEKDYQREFEAFKKKVMKGRTVERWSNKDDLSSRLAESLHNEFYHNERVGWIRADSLENSFDVNKSNLLSKEAIVLLLYASKTNTGRISITKNIVAPFGNEVHCGDFVISNDSRKDASKWEDAIDLLLKKRLIDDKIKSLKIYELTGEGYKLSDEYKQKYSSDNLDDPLRTLNEIV